MRVKDINEGPFQRGVATGFNATQKGGALAPDSLERTIKDYFTKPGKVDDKKDKDKDTKVKSKNTVSTKDPVDANKPLEKGKGKDKKDEKEPTKNSQFPTGVSKGKMVVVKPKDEIAYELPRTGKLAKGKVSKLTQDGRIQVVHKGAVDALDADMIRKVNDQDWVLKSTKTKENIMGKAIKEGLADLAYKAEADHEVQMARADLYKIAKYAIKLHDMLKGVDEEQGLEGWQQAKITKAADYMSSVFHNMEYDQKFGDDQQMDESQKDTHCSDKCCGADVKREDCECPADCEHCNCNDPKVDEGKSPHKKGTKKYKKHMAAMHAETTDSYKQQMAEKLNKKLKASVTPPTAPADIKASNIQAKSLKPIKSTGGGGGGK